MKKTALFLSLAIVFALGCKNDDPEPESKRAKYYDSIYHHFYDTTKLTVYDTIRVPILCDHSYVVYVLNNGTEEKDSLYIKNGATINLKSDAIRSGYDFVKWSTSSTGGGNDYKAGDKYYVSDDITLYAIWQSRDGMRSNEVYDFLAKQEEGSTVDIKIIDLYPDFSAIETAISKFWKVNVNLDLGDATEVGGDQTFSYFTNCANLKSLIFPPNIQSLSTSSGYESCCAFTKLDNIPSSVRTLAIKKCAYLTTLIIPEGVTYLGVSECPKLTSINIPNSVTEIMTYSFRDCSSLTEITIPPSVESIETLDFAGCTNLKTINHSLKDCSGIYFYGCKSLTSITLPEFRIGHTEISYGAFWNCSSLTFIEIPEVVTSIGTFAFLNCTSLTSLTIPKNVTMIGDRAFDNCTSLPSLKIEANNPPALSNGWIGYSGTIYVPSSAVNAYKTADVWKDHADQIVGY